MKRQEIAQVKFAILLLLLLVICYGCAGTKGSVRALQAVEKGVVLCAFENLEIVSEIADGVKMQQNQANRIIELISAKLKEKAPNCFQEITRGCDKPSTLSLTVNFTRYDKGNAFARAMLAGLGQMHIDAMVNISNKCNGKLLAKYEVTKTFAWGGAYGGSKSIEDIEPAFAEAIVSTILQEDK